MNTSYYLSNPFGKKRIEIPKARHDEIVNARDALLTLMGLEESFSLLAKSLIEFEESIFRLSIQYLYNENLNSQEWFFEKSRQEVNLKVVSILTAARAYDERLRRSLPNINEAHTIDFHPKDNLSKAFDSSLEYRIMDGLRNMALHDHPPISSLSYGARKIMSNPKGTDDQIKTRIRHTVTPQLSTSRFCATEKVRKKTRDEVSALNCQHIDVKYLIRVFISQLATCHMAFREKSSEITATALNTLEVANNDMMEPKEKFNAPYICKSDADGNTSEQYIGYENFSIITNLRKEWSTMEHLPQIYISSEFVKTNKTYPMRHDYIFME